MALPPGGIDNTFDGDKKRLLQRADSFSIGSGTREKKDFDEIEEFDSAMDAVIHRIQQAEPQEESGSKQLEEHREDKAKLEAQRRGSSSPSHQPFLGMSILPGISNPTLDIGSTGSTYSKRRSSGVGEDREERVEALSQEIVQGLRAAGLSSPVVTLDDPRLGGASDGLKSDYTFSLSGSERVYVWDRNGCHQIITVGLHATKVESAVNDTVETLIRKGKIDEKSVSRRALPDEKFEFKE